MLKFAIILFLVTYVLMFAFQKIRPYVAVLAAIIFVTVGTTNIFDDFSYDLFQALHEIDWNVLMMIAGTMGTVYFFIESQMPKRIADALASRLHTVKWLIVALSLFAGIISAFVDNVATVLMVAPVAVALCKEHDLSPVPAIICISISSNLQGAATLVGDTTSILLGKAAGLDFMDFFFVEGKPGMFWVTEAGALASALIIMFMMRRETEKVDHYDVTEVKDKLPTVTLICTIVCLIAASFIPYKEMAEPGQFYKPDITNGLICMFFFIVTLMFESAYNGLAALKGVLKEIDYYTIVLLAGLFVVIGGVERAGLIDLIGEKLAALSGSGSRWSVFLIYTVIVWISVLFSAFIDNIPYIATMLPVVAVVAEDLSAAGGIDVHPNLMYFGLLVGATLGGNITPIGASANITGLGLLRKEGYEVGAGTFMKYSVPFTLTAVMVGYLLVWVIWM